MSTTPTADELTDRDRGVLEAMETEADPAQERARLRERNRALEREVEELRDELSETKKTLFGEIHKLKARLDDGDDPRANGYYDDLTILEKYAAMSDAERADLLDGNPTKLRAVAIYRNWTDWAYKPPEGAFGESDWRISTNKTRGVNGKTAIKIDLETSEAPGDDLHAMEVYRALKMVAKLSARERDEVEVSTDEYGRKHIRGGAFEFHEKAHPDTGRKFKQLTLVDEDAITLP